MHMQRMSNFRNRVANIGNDLAPIGTSIMNPDIDYHDACEIDGLVGQGADHRSGRSGPGDQGSGCRRSKSGQPALVNVVTQPR